MHEQREVALWEDEIERGPDGQIVHDPLHSWYTADSEDKTSHGHLSFCGHGLAQSPSFSDVRVFYLEFRGPPAPAIEPAEWADPLRLEALERLLPGNRAWYLGFIDCGFETPGLVASTLLTWWEAERGLRRREVPFAIVRSEKPAIYGPGSMPRAFLECTAETLPHVFARYWPGHVLGYPIEGYCMAPSSIQLLHEWDARPRDASLFREVMERSFVAFYTFPAENRDLVLVTSKLGLVEVRQLLDLDRLQEKAIEPSVGDT